MSTYPTSPRADFLQWCEGHAPVFTKEATAIGLSDPQAAEFESRTIKAAEALVAQEQAQQLARVATRQAQEVLASLQAAAGEAVRSIRAYAETTAAPNTVYAAAQIAPPADPSPTPPPDQPRHLGVALVAATGVLALSWKASNPRRTSGTAYVVRRRLPGETAFAFLGVTGIKRFTDETLPAGTEQVQYTVQGQRGRRSGPVSEILTVTIGKATGGKNVALVNASAPNAGLAAKGLGGSVPMTSLLG